MTYEEWVEQFQPLENHLGDHDQMFETYGDELEYVKSLVPEQRVWTLIETDGLRYILAGYHYVNRLGYFITKEPYTADDIEILDTDVDEPHNRLIDLVEQFEQPEGEGWAVFNIPNEPRDTKPEDWLTVGIERLDEEGRFEDDQEAMDWIEEQAGEHHQLALEIHGEADLVRAILWGDRDRRTPPEQNDV